MAAIVLGVSGVILAIECYVIFSDRTSGVRVPVKDFEDTSFRIWRDTSGKFEMEARFTKLGASNVHLSTKDGKSITIDIQQLSEPDRDYIRSIQSQNPFVVE